MMKTRDLVCFFYFITMPVNLIADDNPVSSNADPKSQVYKSVDSDGNVSFSDEPKNNGEKIKVLSLPVINITPPPNSPTSQAPAKSETDSPYNQLKITSPQEDENIWNQPVITVQVMPQPGLKKNHIVVIMLDGIALPGKGLSRPMENLNRGTHTLSSHIKDSEGKIVKKAVPVQFHVHKASVNN